MEGVGVDAVEGLPRGAELVGARIYLRGAERAAAREQHTGHGTLRDRLDALAGTGDERGPRVELGGHVGAQ